MVGERHASVVWVLQHNLKARARDLLAVPDGGLEMAITLTESVAGGIADLSEQIGTVKASADRLVEAPVIDTAAATELAAAIDEFINGPYAALRAVYGRLRERAITLGDTLAGLSKAVPIVSLPGVAVERLQAIDARLVEMDASMTQLSQAGAAGLAEPSVAARVSERAGNAQATLASMGELVADIELRMGEARTRLVEQDRRIAGSPGS